MRALRVAVAISPAPPPPLRAGLFLIRAPLAEALIAFRDALLAALHRARKRRDGARR